jgi:hypothetical protein
MLGMPIKAYDQKNKKDLSNAEEITKYLYKINKDLLDQCKNI